MYSNTYVDAIYFEVCGFFKKQEFKFLNDKTFLIEKIVDYILRAVICQK